MTPKELAKARKEGAYLVHFHGGFHDGEKLRMAYPLPDVIKMNMGRDEYRVDPNRPNHYHLQGEATPR